jgi:co-chaperonin GroES (HSP10)
MEKETPRGVSVEGLGFVALHDFVFVCDYGQPDMSTGGIYYGDSKTEFGRYRMSEWRFGEVISIGPGRKDEDGNRLPMPEEIEIGSVIMFSRKHGTRMPGDLRFKHPKYSTGPAAEGLLIRVLDPEKCQCLAEGFEPWWNVQESQLDPGGVLTG